MADTTRLSGKIRHKCNNNILLTPQELFELEHFIESRRASDDFTETEKKALTESDFTHWESLSGPLRAYIAEKHYAEFLAAPTVPVDEDYLESSIFRLSLNTWALDPAFRLALSARILADRRRSPNTVGVYERCEQKMNAYLMECALTPSAVNNTQLALAEALFLAQLGGVEVVQTAKGQTGSYFLGAEATVTEPFAHGGRVAFLLPADTDFRALRPCPAVQHFALRKADGTVLRRRARESEHPARQYSADLADKHIYLRPYKGGEGRYAALTLGIRSDAPGGVSPLGHAHSDWAHSERQSGFLSCRETGVGQRIGGRIIDLTPLSSAQLTALMQAFAHGYRALQAQPEVPDALLRVGSLLTGAPLTREEMLALWSHLDADDAEALGAAFDACRSRSLEAPIKPPQLKTGDGCTFAPLTPLTPVHIELRQNEVNWYNRVFGWLPFVDSADDIRRENRRLQNEYRAAQRASDLSFGGNPFEDEIEYSDAVLKPRYRLHRCGLPKERLAIPAQPAAPGRERPLDRKGILSLLLDDRRECTPEEQLFLSYVKGLSGVQRIVDGYLGKSQSALVKNLRSNPDSFARTIMQTIYSDARRNGIDHLPGLARQLIEPELRRHEAARPKAAETDE